MESYTDSSTVVFFSKDGCKFCDMLTDDLDTMRIPYKKVIIDSDIRETLIISTGCLTVPQLFINSEFIGGYSEFKQLCTNGTIITLLSRFDIIPYIDF
jgi:glutaredoxin